jgi:hypothetical protein
MMASLPRMRMDKTNEEWVNARAELPVAEGSYLAVCLLGGKGGENPYYSYRLIDVDAECNGFVWLGAGAIKYPTILYWRRESLPPLPLHERGSRLEALVAISDSPGWVLR